MSMSTCASRRRPTGKCGLRDYGVPGQLGLEKTPEEYVARMVEVFREVRRVLKSDGTLFLNLGDSYAHSLRQSGPEQAGKLANASKGQIKHGFKPIPEGMKEKDLVGIPWRVAFALQQPYYTGRIKREQDRIWLAAMIDGEGCMFIHKRKAGTSAYSRFTKKDGTEVEYHRTQDTFGAGLEVANCHESIVQRCLEITGQGSICHQDKESRLKNRNQRLFRWNLRSNECRGVIREIYPYLTAKKHEARLVLGCPSSGRDAERAHAGLMNLHNGFESDIDFPAPASMFEQGFYLRQDVIWSKANPMPESVRDRCTKAHEYIFMLSKSARYFYDAEAVREPGKDWGTRDRKEGSAFVNGTPGRARQSGGKNCDFSGGRNLRSVWTITTKPMPKVFGSEHFATFPPEIPERCIKAGCPKGGIVLDPFLGAGTTGLVALRLGREFIGIELSPEYCEMARKRIYGTLGAEATP